MKPAQPAWSDERIDQLLGNLLRTGVILASSVVLVAGIIYLWRHGGEPLHVEGIDYRKWQEAQPPFSNSLSEIWAALFVPRFAAYIQLGVLLLIATPVVRVVFSLVTFAIQRDRVYVSVTLFVLVVLLYSLFGYT
jgi:uncharacterized membrane protein